MDDAQFDNIARALGRLASRRLTVGALLGGALGARNLADAEAKKGKKHNGGKGRGDRNKARDNEPKAKSGTSSLTAEKKKKKKTICHCPDGNAGNCVTLTVSKKAAKKHVKQHQFDTSGACSPITTTTAGPTPTTPAPTTTTTTTAPTTTTTAQCSSANQCPNPSSSQPCAQRACIDGVCGFQPLPSGTQCRAAAGECDVAEFCNGTALTCPPNAFRPVGTPCANDGNPCTRDICNGAGACTHPPEPMGTPCADEGNICTRDICNGAGACTHPNQPQNTICGTDRRCCDGNCCAAGETCDDDDGRCCRGPFASCTVGLQCCSDNCVLGLCSPLREADRERKRRERKQR